MASKPTIYLVRHAESVHNVSKDFNHHDPGLTQTGFAQASALADTFSALPSVGVILTSPLTRTIETTLAGFSNILPNALSTDSPTTAERAAKLILDPDLQERSDLPCDTGSDLSVLKAKFPGLDYSPLEEGWNTKTGVFSADDEAVAARAGRVRKKLLRFAKELEASGPEKNAVVVVTHGVFMKFLAEDGSIDLPKAGWKAYLVEESGDEAVLKPL